MISIQYKVFKLPDKSLSNKIKMDNKIQDTKNQQFIDFDKKCTNQPTCHCLICKKQSEIIKILEGRQQLEWFGKKKPILRFNKQTELELQKLELQKLGRRDSKKNRKNQSQSFDVAKHHLDCNSSYFKNYDKKVNQITMICEPQNQLGSDRNGFQNHKSLYNDSFKVIGNLKLEKQMPFKRLQQQFDLPFIGKSSYREEFTVRSPRLKSDLLKPKDQIKTLDLERRAQKVYIKDMNRLKSKDMEMFRPPSPMIPKGHMVKSNSFSSAYNTFYKDSFGKGFQRQFVSSDPNPQFLRRSRFGSLSKTRWMLKPKNHSLKEHNNLQLYK